MIFLSNYTKNLEIKEIFVDVDQSNKYSAKKYQLNPPIIQSTYLVLKDKNKFDMREKGLKLVTDNFFICQDKQTIYFFNIESF